MTWNHKTCRRKHKRYKLFDISLSNIFLDLSPQGKGTEAKINKWDHIKLKSFAHWKKPSIKWKGKLLNGQRVLQMICLIRTQYLKYMKKSYNTISKKKEAIQLKISITIRVVQIKTTMRYHLTPVGKAVGIKTTNKCW